MKKMFFGLFLSICFSVIYADVDTPPFKAPPQPGSALIIYNERGFGTQFSQPAMLTFRTALSRDLQYVRQIPTTTRYPINGDNVPEINPELRMVSVLNVTTAGFDDELYAAFRSDPLFVELYNEGNPLAYWSQVYDLRFNHDFGTSDMSSITTDQNNPKSDISYFKAFLQAGGALYVQTEYKEYVNRNRGVADVIKTFTLDKDYDYNRVLGGNHMTDFLFSDNVENFAHDFNDLNKLAKDYPMKWVMAGGYPVSNLRHGVPLITNGSAAVMVFWGTKQLDPAIGNGRLIVGFDINAWGDHYTDSQEGKITKATFAVIQNLYDLMSGTNMFSVKKSFSENGEIPQIEDGQTGTCYITVKNNATYAFEITVVDTLNRCFEFIKNSNDNIPLTKQDNLSNSRTALEWDRVELKGRGSGEDVKVIKFEYRVKYLPPCN